MAWLSQSYKDWGLSHGNNLFFRGLLNDAFSHKVKAKRISLMADVKLNSDSDDVGTKFKIIGISVALGLNVIVFIWYFFFSGLT